MIFTLACQSDINFKSLVSIYIIMIIALYLHLTRLNLPVLDRFTSLKQNELLVWQKDCSAIRVEYANN